MDSRLTFSNRGSREKQMIGYSQHKSLRNYQCYYCGCAAGTIDHYPPRSERFNYPHSRIMIRACFDCNVYLADSMQNTLEERKLRALGRFSEKEDLNQGTS